MKKNYLISTGGSGGHVIPALIFHQHLSGDANIIISSDKRGLKYLNKDIYNLEIVNTPKLSSFILLPINLLLILILTFKSIFLLKNKKIEKLISTGGYMSLPLILASKLLNLKIYLLEPNLILGRSNKLFLNSCVKIFCYNEKIKKKIVSSKLNIRISRTKPKRSRNLYHSQLMLVWQLAVPCPCITD